MTRQLLVCLLGAVTAVALGGSAADSSQHRDPDPASLPHAGPLTVAARDIVALETPAQLGPGARIVLFGDSVAASVASGLVPEAARRGARVVPATVAGCSGLRGLPVLRDGSAIPWAVPCEDHVVRSWRPGVAATPADAILWLSSWDLAMRMVDGGRADPATPEGRQVIAGLIRETADIIAPPGGGRRIVFVLGSPISPSSTHGQEPRRESVVDMERARAVFHLVVRGDPARFSILPLDPFLCPSGPSPTGPPCPLSTPDGAAPRAEDGGHFTHEGSAWLAPRLLDALGVT